jgi:hypothetical protein
MTYYANHCYRTLGAQRKRRPWRQRSYTETQSNGVLFVQTIDFLSCSISLCITVVSVTSVIDSLGNLRYLRNLRYRTAQLYVAEMASNLLWFPVTMRLHLFGTEGS